eukprot:c7351_g1_i2.p1 GENE.c7351_g1_i2~~c7351_g1_i2.p1  ORF type:complete len:128 (+),score=34.89 c7351_g1_i2:1-384(+)
MGEVKKMLRFLLFLILGLCWNNILGSTQSQESLSVNEVSSTDKIQNQKNEVLTPVIPSSSKAIETAPQGMVQHGSRPMPPLYPMVPMKPAKPNSEMMLPMIMLIMMMGGGGQMMMPLLLMMMMMGAV